MTTIGKRRLALILGSGFSKEAGLPTTRGLSSEFLATPQASVLAPELEQEVTRILKKFWHDVFGYRPGGRVPSMEDHFTVIDLAANSGHQLGRYYTPKRLRAIRRFSIHRVFQILDRPVSPAGTAGSLLAKLCRAFDVSIVTLNWDIVAEKLLGDRGVCYGISVEGLPDTFKKPGGVPLLKVHGSSNWVYCDSCRRLYAGAEKSALHKKAFLKTEDFRVFEVDEELLKELKDKTGRECLHCGNFFGGRVATFSYRKAFSINQFQTVWGKAHSELTEADTWMFVGYSMPDADFEFKHLLKSAQLGRKRADRRRWRCEVILKDDEDAANRYRPFFGGNRVIIHQDGLAAWVDRCLGAFCGGGESRR